VLGEEPLAARCADHLMQRGHMLVGMVASSAVLRQWAKARNIQLLTRAEYSHLLATTSVDLLLSITYPQLISPMDIARVGFAALNYHDGPLPRYAGMNGSAWALAAGEERHAIVWHQLTAGLDEGDIVERRDIELDSRETSLSLNMQSSALALESFQVMLGRLERGDRGAEPQSSSVERSVYSRHDRPDALCTLDLKRTAAGLDCLIRACDFGPYPNRFGLPKLVGPAGALIVLEASVSGRRGAIGEVLEILPDALEVACGQGALRILRSATLKGAPLSPVEAALLLGVKQGDRILDPGREERQAISRSTAEAEPWFVSALRSRLPVNLPFDAREQIIGCAAEVRLPEPFRLRFEADLDAAAIALYAFVLSSICRQDAFDLALVNTLGRQRLGGSESLFYPSVPLRVDVDARLGFDALSRTLGDQRLRLAKRGAFLCDLVLRHPELARDTELSAGLLSSACVVLGAAEVPKGSALALRVTDRGIELTSESWLDTRRLDALAHHMQAVAGLVARAAERPLSQIDLLTEEEREAQVFQWNATARQFPSRERLHDGFEKQLALAPDAVALVHAGNKLTFAELELAANRVANTLVTLGVRPGERVGLYVERGFELVFGMLGVAKAGAAYVPLDTAYPEDRVSFMLDDAGCAVVLVSADLARRIGGQRTLVDIAGPDVRQASTVRPACPASADDVCYTIYTSGSTGRPKGVVLTHRAVVNTLDWVNRTLAVGPKDRLLFVTSPSFDLSVYDIFGALGAGASVEIASSSLLADPAELARRLIEPGLTIWDSAPPALARLAPFLRADTPGSTLRCVMLSGDWIPVWLPALLAQCFPGVRVQSLGGATEAAIWSNHYHVERTDPRWTSIPYGYPIQNCRYYVLDQHLRPLPIEVTGDLYIAGVCLAQGYLNRPELTEERFIGDPFVPGERMYKTGDLARYWRDGTLEFLGRADSQVKIRGFRVELGEIETALTQLPDVCDAVCSVYLDASEQKSLVAYLVPLAGKTLEPQALRERLAAGLPDFMLPSHFVVLAELPLSANGKVDRKALPSPTGRSNPEAPVAPRNDTERALVDIWQELLKKETVGIRDDFFALGGHSLLAVMLISRIRRSLGVDLPLSRVLDRPTIELLAEWIDKSSGAPASVRHLVALSPRGSRPAIVMVAGIGGYAFTYQKFGTLFGKEQPLYALQAVGIEGKHGDREHSIEEVAEIYATEVMRERPTGPLILAGFSFGALAAFELGVQLRRRGREIPLIISFDGFAPGYPAVLPWPARLKAHAAELRGLSSEERSQYLAQRVANVRSRVLNLLGRGAEEAPEVPFADTDMSERLKNSWANHMIARRRYRTSATLDAALLLIRAEIPERWAATAMADPLYGWQGRVTGPISAITAPGDHTAVMTLTNQELIVQAITVQIDEYLARQAL
jgi:amino acid adenylation domain-containing protein